VRCSACSIWRLLSTTVYSPQAKQAVPYSVPPQSKSAADGPKNPSVRIACTVAWIQHHNRASRSILVQSDRTSNPGAFSAQIRGVQFPESPDTQLPCLAKAYGQRECLAHLLESVVGHLRGGLGRFAWEGVLDPNLWLDDWTKNGRQLTTRSLTKYAVER
jgi:hypothetical protein